MEIKKLKFGKELYVSSCGKCHLHIGILFNNEIILINYAAI
jgi:hypothetical protein